MDGPEPLTEEEFEFVQTAMRRIGKNEGHGWCWPRPDGAKVHCGPFCDECKADAQLVLKVNWFVPGSIP